MKPLESFFRNENNTGTITFLLVIMLLMLPYGFNIQIAEDWHSYQVYSAVWELKNWSYASGVEVYNSFGFPDPYAFLISLIVGIFRYVFTIQIIRHHRAETTQKRVRISAVLTLIPLAPLFFLSLFSVSNQAGGGLTGPIPLFMILGLIIDHFWGIEPAVAPWDD
ncbi:MAG: hypothetical protein ACTSV2_15945 [Candidatus Thorarchaeota archaeon]